MTWFSQLALLVFAFLGIDVSEANLDVDVSRCDWGDFHESHDGWEDCLIPDRDGSNSYDLPKSEWSALVQEAWADYQPWMYAQLVSADEGWRLRRFTGKCRNWTSAADPCIVDEQNPHWEYNYFDSSFEPPVPKLVHGKSAVKKYCGSSTGCYYRSGFNGVTLESLDYGWWVTPDASLLTFDVNVVTRVLDETPRIALPTRGGLVNRFTALHLLAHAISDYRDFGVHRTLPPVKAGKYDLFDVDLYSSGSQWLRALESNPEWLQHERMGGHGIAFRCLVLDLYRAHTDAVPDDVYSVLNGLCRQYVPNYATPHEGNSDSR